MICEELRRILKQQESVREVLSVFQFAVLDSLYDTIHAYPDLNALKVGDLAESVNADLRQRGEPGSLTEKRMGNLLTSLQLTIRTRINIGWVLWLTRETREQIHSLARAYGVNGGPTPELSAGCVLCQNMTAHPTNSSKTKPVEENPRAKANNAREHGEHRERGKRGTRNKATPAARVASPRRGRTVYLRAAESSGIRLAGYLEVRSGMQWPYSPDFSVPAEK
jgi:hypothetical protein